MPAQSKCSGAQRLAHIELRQFLPDRACHCTILNALAEIGRRWMALPQGKKGRAWRSTPACRTRVYPRCALDGVPWKYPVVPLKLGVFQELRDASSQATHIRRMVGSSRVRIRSMSLPDRGKTIEAFGKMDFIATVDIVMNDTAWFSDVVLPEASYLERYDPLLPMGDKAFLRQPVIEPQGEAKSALWIYKQLGERLGLGDFFQYTDEEDYIRQQLAPLGVSLEEVKEKGYAELPEGGEATGFTFNTPSGKIEFIPRR
jgi:thiosulfate reductase / polysulfide reductase chain A